ncbi:MAG TPA: S-methyl-5-thioribose-1-phosphate isomerase, partial [Candidatus Polarisedimenticolia bacterium]|nr:S-methyl-5-thioribose-1-phosphate isomerase [Candidatus Polarisedimenticolia bacterium]
MSPATRTIEWRDDAIVIVDQTVLPGELRLIEIRTVDELVIAIRQLAVRGAMALGVAGALGVALAARNGDVGRALDDAAGKLVGARPTAVNLAWGVKRALAARAGGRAAILDAAL